MNFFKHSIVSVLFLILQPYALLAQTDLPDIDIEMYVDGVTLKENGFNEDDLVDEVEIADGERINELIEEAEASLVF